MHDSSARTHSTEGLSEHGSKAYLAGVCGVASLGGLLFGFDTAVISGTVDFVRQQFGLNELQVGWFGGSALYGCIVGALVGGGLGDRFGRKPMLIVSAVLFFVSAFLSAIPPSFAVLIPARIIGGLGVGMASVLAPMFISEFSPPHLRGRLVALYQMSIVIGILLAYFSNWCLLTLSQSGTALFGGGGALHQILVGEVWRGMFGMEMFPAAIFFFLLFWVPESPRWLIKAGHVQRGVSVLTRIAGQEEAERELAEIQDALNHEEGTIWELFRPGLRGALLVGVGLSFFGQFTGVNIIVYYGPEILQAAGFTKNAQLLFTIAFGVINLLGTLIALFIIDKQGRRPLLIGGMAMVTVSLFFLATLYLFKDTIGASAGPLIVGVCGLYIGFLAISINAVIWVLTPEIFPNRVRGRAASIATFTNWSINALTATLFLSYVESVGMHGGFYTFAACCLVATIFFYKLVPETKGKTLEEIEKCWESSAKRQ